MPLWGDNPSVRLEVDLRAWVVAINKVAPKGSLLHYLALGVLLLCVFVAARVVHNELVKQAEASQQKQL